MTKVVNKYKKPFDVYIGRGSQFGNPFTIQDYGRSGCIAKFKIYFYNKLKNSKTFRTEVQKLKGKILGCYCKPKVCHGDIIVQYLEMGRL